MFNRARENYQKQISNINMKNNKKYSPIKIKSLSQNEQNGKDNISNKINFIQENKTKLNKQKLPNNIILPKIASKNIINYKTSDKNPNIKTHN